MKKVLLLTLLSTVLIGCAPKQSQAELEADAATREYIRTLVSTTNNLIQIREDEIKKEFEINSKYITDTAILRRLAEPVVLPAIDTASLLIGLDKMRGKELHEKQKYVAEFIESVKRNL